jgi:hypothetical protein
VNLVVSGKMDSEPWDIGSQPDEPRNEEAERRRFLGLELWQQFIAGLGVAAVVALATVAVHVFYGSPKHTGSIQSPATSPAQSPTTTRPSTPIQEPIKFFNLNENEKVGALIQPLKITGTVPSNKQAWVLVKSSGLYYIQGPLKSESADFRTLSTVSLGSTQGPIDIPYVISVVLANSQADRTIKSDYSRTGDCNTGIAEIPDGSSVIHCITVIRTH